MKSKLRHFFLLTFSTLVMAAGTYFFKFPNNFTFGGITGLAVLVAKTGVMSAGDFNFITNMILLIIGFFILGKKFAAKTAYCSILLSVALSALERIYPMSAPLTNQPMLELCFAIALPSLGSAILFNIGSSSGGTDIIAMILKKYSSVDIGHALLITDVLITVAGCFIPCVVVMRFKKTPRLFFGSAIRPDRHLPDKRTPFPVHGNSDKTVPGDGKRANLLFANILLFYLVKQQPCAAADCLPPVLGTLLVKYFLVIKGRILTDQERKRCSGSVMQRRLESAGSEIISNHVFSLHVCLPPSYFIIR